MDNDRTTLLVRQAQAGDNDAVAELLSLYGKMAYTVIRHLLYPRPDVDDVYQEACVQALTSIASLRYGERFGGWFKRIAIRKAIDHLRRKEAQPWPNIPEDFAAECLTETVALQGEYEEVRRAVVALPLHYREVVVLYYWSECTYKEISTALSIPLGTVMSRMYKAKGLLTEKLESPKQKGVGQS